MHSMFQKPDASMQMHADVFLAIFDTARQLLSSNCAKGLCLLPGYPS